MIAHVLCAFLLVVCGTARTPSTSKAVDQRRRASIGPEHIHLAVGHDPTQMTVSWVSYEDSPMPSLHYGTTKALEFKTKPTTKQFEMSTIPRNTTGGFVGYKSGLIRHMQLTDLKADTLYYYQIEESSVLSELLSFTTLPEVGASSYPVNFIAMGDLGQTEDSRMTVARALLDSNAHMILHAGDMSYADCDLTRWETYFTMIEPLAQTLPWMVIPGNHEIEPNNLTGNIMDPYKNFFQLPEAAPTIDTTTYYQTDDQEGWDCTPSAFTGAFDFGNSFYTTKQGPAQIFFLNSYTGTNETTHQYQWLEKELQAVDRSVTPWVIALWHSPWYNSNTDHQGEFNTLAMRESMEPLMLKYGVNIVLNGHVHAYERTFPVALDLVDASGIVYIKIGDGGNREGHADSYLPTPDWSAFRNGISFGHGKLEIVSKTVAHWSWISNDGVSNEWVAGDEVDIMNHWAV